MISWDLPIHWLLGAVEIGTSQATFGIGGSLHHPLPPTGLADACCLNVLLEQCSYCIRLWVIYIYILYILICACVCIFLYNIYIYMYNTHLHSIPMVGFSSLGFWSQGSPKALPAYPLRVGCAPQLPGDCGQLWEHEDVCHWHQWGCSTRHLHIGVWVMSRCPKNGGDIHGYPSYCLMGYYNWCNHGIQRNVMN